jgi:predicted permease
MELLNIFSQSLLPILIIILVAFIYNRIFNPDIKNISEVVLTIFAPIMVFDALVKQKIPFVMMVKPFLFMIILISLLIIISFFIAKIFKFNETERTSIILASSMINVGNFGLPLILFTFGEKAVAISVIYFVVFLIPINTIGIYISSNEKNMKSILKGMMKMPLFHSIFFAMLIVNLSIPIPMFIEKSLHLLGNAAIPMLLFILGLQLAKIKFHKKYILAVLIVVFIRLVLSPIISFFSLDLLGITGLERQIALVQTSAPAAVLPLIYAIKFDKSPDLLAAIILGTTIISGISLTILIAIIS